jgi:hypothetical protein
VASKTKNKLVIIFKNFFNFLVIDKGKPSIVRFILPHRIKERVLFPHYWVLHFISLKQFSSLKTSFEIELSLLDFNMVLEPPFGCWVDLSSIIIHIFDDHTTCEEVY